MKTIWAVVEDVLQYVWAALVSYASTPEGAAKLAEIEGDLANLSQPTVVQTGKGSK